VLRIDGEVIATITVLTGNKVRIGVDAVRDLVTIHRKEVDERLYETKVSD
jgi:sRNA-binding carbon storage regulator CsrA